MRTVENAIGRNCERLKWQRLKMHRMKCPDTVKWTGYISVEKEGNTTIQYTELEPGRACFDRCRTKRVRIKFIFCLLVAVSNALTGRAGSGYLGPALATLSIENELKFSIDSTLIFFLGGVPRDRGSLFSVHVREDQL